MLTSVLTELLNRSVMRWLNGLMPASTRLIQPSASCGVVHCDQTALPPWPSETYEAWSGFFGW